MRTRHLLPVALVFAIAGCGSSNSKSGSTNSTASSSGASTKADFIAKADNICSEAQSSLNAQQQKINAAIKADNKSDTPANRAAVANEMRADTTIATPLLGKLRALTPPAADAAVINRYLSGVASQTALINQLADAIKTHDTKAINSLGTKIQAGGTAVQGVAKGYGFKVCGSS